MPAASESDLQLEIGHVLLIDIVGYSKLLITEQRERLQALNEIVRNTAQFCASDANDMLVRIPTGDGMALIFRDSVEAPVHCALEISQAVKNHPEIHLRMGIHSGPVSEVTDVNERPNIAGAGIDTAQRVMDCGDAGHILLSKHVADDIAPYPRWNPYLHDLGECEVKHGRKIFLVNLYTDELGNPTLPEKLKGICRQPVETAAQGGWSRSARIITLLSACLVAIVAVIMLLQHGATNFAKALMGSSPAYVKQTSATERSIAILPFIDLSQARDQEYFCDGISEEILDALAKVEGLRVVARTSSFSFKGKNADVSEIAQKLNVENVLEGSLRREGNRIRITAQLINVRDGFDIWSDTFERDLQGVFAVQDEITRSIVDALKIKLAVAPTALPRQNTEAYDLYLQGLYFSNKSDEESLWKSLNLFQRALDKDATFARAWTGIAKTWYWLADVYVKPLEAYPKMMEAASKAVALDERDAEAHCYLGEAKRILDRNLSGEAAQLNRALELDANSATAHLIMALFQSAQGRLEEAVNQIQKAKELDPLSPAISYFAVGRYLATDRIDEAIAEGQRTLQLDTNFQYLTPPLAEAYLAKGKFEEALVLYEKAQEATHVPSSGLAITYARLGRRADARRILDQLLAKARTQYFPADSIAAVYVALGDKDEAFSWLERAFEEHSYPLYTFLFAPEFRPLRSDPRFADLLRRIGVDPVKAFADQKNPGT
jgi:adenylate cyclase